MAVVARFYVAEVAKYASGGFAPPAPQGKVTLRAVARGEENKAWASATPSGTVEMVIKNSPAFVWFDERVGRDIAITFEDAPEVGD